MPIERKSRLSPPLMYAFRSAHNENDSRTRIDLRDEGGDRVIAARRQPARKVITEPLLRREVMQDLDNLMNAVSLDATDDLSPFEEVQRSILNFGFPDLSHRTIDEAQNTDIGGEIATALLRFEPRLRADSVRVARDMTIDTAALKIRFVVRADLVCNPVNVPVEFVADVELDSGKVAISRL